MQVLAVNRIADVAQSAGTPRQEARRPGFRSARSLAVWTASIVLLLGVRPAHAYLDPGTGSMILQLVLGGVAGGAIGNSADRSRSRDYCESYLEDYLARQQYGYGQPGVTYGYVQQQVTMMVPVMMVQQQAVAQPQRECKETVVTEEWVPVRPKRRVIYKTITVPDKRVRIVPDKRVRIN